MELWPFPHPRIKNESTWCKNHRQEHLNQHRETVKRIRTEIAEESRQVEQLRSKLRRNQEELDTQREELQRRMRNLQRLMQIRNERRNGQAAE